MKSILKADLDVARKEYTQKVHKNYFLRPSTCFITISRPGLNFAMKQLHIQCV